MKNRNNLNLFIDVLLTVTLAVLAGIGWLLKYTLPPGRDRILKTGENRELFFLGWDRHQWGTVHLVAALVMLGLLVLHIIFHWNQILCMVRTAVPSASLRRILTGGIILLSVIAFLAAFVIEPKKGETDDFLYRNARGNVIEPQLDGLPAAESSSAPAKAEDQRSNGEVRPETASGEPPATAVAEENHPPGSGGDALLSGRMTLKETAALYKITTAEVKRKLGLPEAFSDLETLGRLRRGRGLTMVQIRSLLEERR